MEVTLMEKFADPALIESLSTGEKAMGALITTGMGMGITFMVLLLLWGVIWIMSKCLTNAGSKPKEEETIVKTGEIKIPEVALGEEGIFEETQLVAVIAAAIEAYEGNRGYGGEGFVVRRITRVQGNPWGAAGISECTNGRM